MAFLVRYELSSSSPEDETKEMSDVIDLVANHQWEDEIKADDQNGEVSSIDIIDEANGRILTTTVMEKKEDILFTVESLMTGRNQKGKVGTLINDLPHSECVKVVDMFCRGDFASIDEMDNTGLFSKFCRKIVFLFATDDWHKET